MTDVKLFVDYVVNDWRQIIGAAMVLFIVIILIKSAIKD